VVSCQESQDSFFVRSELYCECCVGLSTSGKDVVFRPCAAASETRRVLAAMNTSLTSVI